MIYSSYQVITPPATIPVTLDLVKIHLKLDASDTSQDPYLTLLIESATLSAECYMRRILINTKFRTFRDRFCINTDLRKSKLQSLDLYEYVVDGSYITVPVDLYYITDEHDYSQILLRDNESYPTNIDNQRQSVKIEFTAGYGTSEDDIPADIKIALVNHIALIYEDRGDCNTTNIPAESKRTYDKYRILDLIGEQDYEV